MCEWLAIPLHTVGFRGDGPLVWRHARRLPPPSSALDAPMGNCPCCPIAAPTNRAVVPVLLSVSQPAPRLTLNCYGVSGRAHRGHLSARSARKCQPAMVLARHKMWISREQSASTTDFQSLMRPMLEVHAPMAPDTPVTRVSSRIYRLRASY